MADGRIISGGDGLVKTYKRNPNRTITVKWLQVPGAQVTIRIDPPDGGTNDGSTTGTEAGSRDVQAPLGPHTLVVDFSMPGRPRGKELRQQITVVDA